MSQVEQVDKVDNKRSKRIEKAFTKTAEKAEKASSKDLKKGKGKKEEKEDTSEVVDYQVTKGAVRKDDLAYEKLSMHEQILLRPNMYIGSCTTITELEPVWTFDNDAKRIVKKTVPMNDGLLRIFIEVVSNAIDNVWRSSTIGITPKFIKIYLSKNEVSVWNDGRNIPTGLHEKEKIHVPEMIFGHLLTSSNYNDNEERKTSGLNGVGSKCLELSTQVPGWNGQIFTAGDIKVGDQLIGDDGTMRTVQSVVKGKGPMYRISQVHGEDYIVNDQHILTLHMPDHKVIFWNTSECGFTVLWWDSEHLQIKSKQFSAFKREFVCPECDMTLASSLSRHMRRQHPDATLTKTERKSPTVVEPEKDGVKEARREAELFCQSIPDNNVFDISVSDYLKLNKTTQGRLAGVRGQCVQWPKQEVSLDPYILGLWLGDGYHEGRAFAIHEKLDPEILQAVREWCAENGAEITQYGKDIINWGIKSATKERANPLRKQLNKYNLVKNKHIPKEYLLNDRETRLKVLAGFIDTDGYAMREGTRICIAQGLNHTQLMHDLVFLVRSLGFACSLTKKKTSWTYLGEKRFGEALYANISGDIDEIPTRVPRKKCKAPYSHNMSKTTGRITVLPVEEKEYIGIAIDGNERFVINDFTVTHNCTNVFSTNFSVQIFNKEEKVLYEQAWENNMKTCHKPVITKNPKQFKTAEEGKNGFTKVTFQPDFARFGFTEFTEDMLNHVRKIVYDTAMTVSIHKVSVFLNEEEIKMNKLTDYVSLYYEEAPSNMITFQTADSYVVLAPNVEWCHVSFVNGIFTRDGGVHVDKWAEAIFRPIIEKLNGSKGKGIDMRDVKKHFFLFVYADLDKPKFNDQSKHKLNAPFPTVEVKPAQIAKIMKWEFVEKIEESLKAKDMQVLQKNSERKRGTVNVEGLEDANLAGKGKADCALFISEGLSARTYVVAGMKHGFQTYKGRDTIGVLPIRGKFLNVKNASAVTLSKNTELIAITQALGLTYGTDYTDDKNFSKLRYKKLILASDSDVDGHHITGLIYNLFHTLFPSLLKRKGFFSFMRTPIIKITQGKKAKPINFYFYEQAKKYIDEQKPTSTHIRYFKGLGTSRDEDIKQDFGKRIVEVELDEKGDKMMENVFGGEESDFRKQWIQSHEPRTDFPEVKEGDIEHTTITDFLNLELINYSIEHCKRSIPCIMDGLKESQRKILYAGFKRNLKYTGESLKVAQFGAYTAEHSNYHHGEANLYDTIVKMAQRYVGSNNLALFLNDGQMGSRSEYGKDAAAARYIFTKLDMCTRALFREEDEPYLIQRMDDGDLVEPETYYPVIPLILVNGTAGSIASGWSSTIPPYHLKDIIAWIKAWLYEKETPELAPYFRGFKGNVSVQDNKVMTEGSFEVTKKGICVTEIPIGKRMMSINKYKEFLKDLQESGKLKSIEDQSTENQVCLYIKCAEGFDPTVQTLQLTDSISLSNMVMFDTKGKLHKYDSVYDILAEWCDIRFDQYEVRKKGQLEAMEVEKTILYNRIRFMQSILDEKLILKNKDEDMLCKELREEQYTLHKDSFDYLLNTSVKSMTAGHLKDLQAKYTALCDTMRKLAATSIKTIWCGEMDELLVQYEKWCALQ